MAAPLRLTEATELFLGHGRDVRRLSAATLRAYRGDLSQFGSYLSETHGDLDVAEVTTNMIEDFVASCPDLSALTIARRVSTLSALFRFLRKRQQVEVNVMEAVDRPKVPRTEAAFVTEEDAQRLLAVVDGQMEKALLLTFLCTGLRRSEALALNTGEVDLTFATLTVRCGKGSKSRSIPITDELGRALRAHLQSRDTDPEGPLFTSKAGTRLHQTSLQRIFHRWVRDAGLEGTNYTLHSLRHSAATRWIRAGLNVADVQELLGHADVGTTSRYLHSSPEHLREEMARKVPPITSPDELRGERPITLTPEMARGLEFLGQLAQASGFSQFAGTGVAAADEGGAT